MEPTIEEQQTGFRFPFGEESCEHEFKVLQKEYKKFYYNQSRFNAESLDGDVYLIVGRRGSGKTSLTKYFGFQDIIKTLIVLMWMNQTFIAGFFGALRIDLCYPLICQ